MIPKWLLGKTIAVYDIETDRIPTTIVYSIGIGILTIALDGSTSYVESKAYTKFWTPYSNGSLMQAVSIINKCDYVSGHGIINFDNPEVKKHLGATITPTPLDTIILAKIIISKDDLYAMDAELNLDKDLWGKYSLKAFGQRLGDFKIDFSSFETLTEEMVIYMNQDVDLTCKLLLNLIRRPNFPLEEVVTIEHQAAAVIAEQTFFGFYLDITRTRLLNTALLQEKGALARELAEIFGPKFLKDGPVKQYKKVSKTRLYLPDTKYIPVW